MNTLPQTVVCLYCKIEKDISNFYVYRGEVQKICKGCRSNNKQVYPQSKFSPTVPSQLEVIALLSEMGIFATPGKHSAYNYVDVVAWGCVRIEVKRSLLSDKRRAFIFQFTRKQQEDGLSADLLWLTCDYGDLLTHHIFEVNDRIISNAMKDRLKCLYYKPDKLSRHRHGVSHSLTDAIMQRAENRFDLIEQYRVNWYK